MPFEKIDPLYGDDWEKAQQKDAKKPALVGAPVPAIAPPPKPTFEKIDPLYGDDFERAQQKEKMTPPSANAAPARGTMPARPADPLGGPAKPFSWSDPLANMPKVPSPFDVPEVADFAEGVFGRSPLGIIRDLTSQVMGGKIPTQAEKTAAAVDRSPVAAGAGRVFSDVATAQALKPFGVFGANAAPEVIDAVANKGVLAPNETGAINWYDVAKAAGRATMQGKAATYAGDILSLPRTLLEKTALGPLAGLIPKLSIPGGAQGTTTALPQGILEWMEQTASPARADQARAAAEKRKRQAEESKK